MAPMLQVWRNAMLMADASRVGPLDAHGEFIRSLNLQLPKWWPNVHKTDHDMRAHKWVQIRAGIQDHVEAGAYRGEFDPARP